MEQQPFNHPFNQVAFFQAGIARKFMKRHHLTPQAFLEMDKAYHLFRLLEIGYEPFHLTGDEGVLDELDGIVAEQQATQSAAADQPDTGLRL